MAWSDGELFPVAKRWECAPEDIAECQHERGVVAPKEPRTGSFANTQGRICLHCMVCDLSWWEPSENIKGSPWSP